MQSCGHATVYGNAHAAPPVQIVRALGHNRNVNMHGTGRVLVATKFGIISQPCNDHWILSDCYASCPNVNAVLPDKPQIIHDGVRLGSFVPKVYPKSTLQKAHQEMAGESSGGK